jgi:hypothetical protein
MMTGRTVLLLLLGALLSAALPAEPLAQVTGVVLDSSGAVLLHAAVTVINEDTGIRRGAQSSDDGTYAIASLPPGIYKITFRKDGFRTVARLNVNLLPAENARIDATMQVGSTRQVVTINDGPTLMNSENASVGLLVERDMIDELPLNGRGVLSLLDLAPGVVATPATGGEAGQFSANGQRANTNYFTVDGVSANTSVSGGSLPAQFAGGALPAMTAFGSLQNLVSTDALQEARIQTSSFAPEFGRMAGAHVGLSTRSGSNELHGSVSYSLRNEKLDANDWFSNLHGLAKAPLRLNQWGGSLGGPLRRDRTFFFASYEGLRLAQPFTWLSVVPSDGARESAPPALRPFLNAFPKANSTDFGAGLAQFIGGASRPARLDTGSLRIDHALTPRTSLFARYNQAPSSTAFGYSQVDESQYRAVSFTAGATSMVRSGWNNDFRLNVSRGSVASNWIATNAGGAVPLNFQRVFPGSFPNADVLYGFGIANVGEILAGAGGTGRQGQWNAVETLAINRGVHAVRLGADYDQLTPERDRLSVSLAGRYQDIGDILAGRPMEVVDSQSQRASSSIRTLSLFLQDTWRILPRLTLTYGTRWELTPAPAYGPASAAGPALPVGPLPPPPGFSTPISSMPGSPSVTASSGKIWATRYTQFAPRVGAAYLLSPHSVLRAGWGIFYDLSFSVATDPINGAPFNRWEFNAATPTAPVPVASTVPSYGFAPDLRLPYSREWNVTYEQALTTSDVVSLAYVGSSGHDLLRREGTLGAGTVTAQQIVATNHGASSYNGLELQYRRRLARGLQGLVSYTWSHSLDNASWDSGLYLVQPGITASRDWASSAFDVRRSFNAALSFDLPRLGHALLRDWSMEGILRVRSGFPIDVLVDENVLGLGFDNVTRPDLARGVPVWIEDGSAPGGRRLNPAAFTTPAGQQGNLGRNAVTGFGLAELDLAVRREFKLSKESVLQLRFEGFNALNHPALADPVPFLNSPVFGQSTSMLNFMLGSGSPHSGLTPAFQIGGPRSLQMSLRFRF